MLARRDHDDLTCLSGGPPPRLCFVKGCSTCLLYLWLSCDMWCIASRSAWPWTYRGFTIESAMCRKLEIRIQRDSRASEVPTSGHRFSWKGSNSFLDEIGWKNDWTNGGGQCPQHSLEWGALKSSVPEFGTWSINNASQLLTLYAQFRGETAFQAIQAQTLDAWGCPVLASSCTKICSWEWCVCPHHFSMRDWQILPEGLVGHLW